MHRAHSTLPPAPPATTAEATIHAHATLRDIVTACERLAAGDLASADSAFKRVMVAAGDARAALQPALTPNPKAQVDAALKEWT